jgi:hypothetical protein
MNFALIFWVWMLVAVMTFVIGAVRADFPVGLTGFILMLLLVAFMSGAELATPDHMIEVLP